MKLKHSCKRVFLMAALAVLMANACTVHAEQIDIYDVVGAKDLEEEPVANEEPAISEPTASETDKGILGDIRTITLGILIACSYIAGAITFTNFSNGMRRI